MMAIRVALERPDAGVHTRQFPPVIRQMCQALSPDGPEHFPVVFEKLKPNWVAPGVSLERLGDVQNGERAGRSMRVPVAREVEL